MVEEASVVAKKVGTNCLICNLRQMVPTLVALFTLATVTFAPTATASGDPLLAAALAHSPPETAWQAPSHPETVEARSRRYRAIVADVRHAVARQPPIEGFTRQQTAMFVIGMALGETRLAADADVGECYRKGAYRGRCDGGRAVGILQVHIHPSERAYYFSHRRRLLARGLRGLRQSFNACRHLPRPERLAAYGAGSCASAKGRAASRKRWRYIMGVMR